MCEETVKDGCDSLLMPVCGSVGGRGTSGTGMGYHGNVLLKTNDVVSGRRECVKG